MALVGNRYIQSSDPGAVGAGYQWLDSTTGNLYERNTTNAGWVLFANVNQTNGGLLPLTGGNLSGSITGATGFATVDSPNFTTAAKLEGVNLATTRDLDNLQELLSGEIDQKVSSSLSALIGGQNANVAVKEGVETKTVTQWKAGTATLTPPQFSDGTTATDAQCTVHVALHGIASTDKDPYVKEIGKFEYQIDWRISTPADSSNQCGFSYIIVATR